MNINLIINATRKAAPLLLRDYNEMKYLRHSPKSLASFINNSKLRTAEILTQECQKYFPQHLIMNAQEIFDEPKHESYILFDPLEGEANIQNNLKFFAINVLVISKKNQEVLTSVVLNFPALDLICCASSKEGVWLENYQDSSKVKLKHCVSGSLVIVDKIEQSALDFTAAHNLNLENIRSFGSKSYSIMQLAAGNATAYLTNDKSVLYTKIIQFISQALKYFKTEYLDLNLYTTQKPQTQNILSLKRSL
jgi:fructose-1,6-bisphosphatase/inositol monophosphatase family enzyme